MVTEEWHRRLVFDALIKESEFLRAEELLAIQNVRRLTITSLSIAGFSIPVIAGLLGALKAPDGNSSVSLAQVFQDQAALIYVISVGEAIAHLALLRIYLGSFSQIFAIAQYLREVVQRHINTVCEPDEGCRLFHWEEWLKGEREKTLTASGDVDLVAEPVVIAGGAVIFALLALWLSYTQGILRIPTTLFAALVLLAVVETFVRLSSILRTSAGRPPLRMSDLFTRRAVDAIALWLKEMWRTRWR